MSESISAVVEPTGEPKFVITRYPSSVDVSPGGSFTVDVTVENQGDAVGYVEVRIKDHNGNIVASQETGLQPLTSATFTFNLQAPSEEGQYTWTVEAYNKDLDRVDDTKTFTVNVTAGAPSTGEVTYEEAGAAPTGLESIVKFCFMAELVKMLRGEEPDLSKCIQIYVNIKMIEVLTSAFT